MFFFLASSTGNNSGRDVSRDIWPNGRGQLGGGHGGAVGDRKSGGNLDEGQGGGGRGECGH